MGMAALIKVSVLAKVQGSSAIMKASDRLDLEQIPSVRPIIPLPQPFEAPVVSRSTPWLNEGCRGGMPQRLRWGASN